jgi:membrane associated rhomboid family serine protease
MSYYRNPPHRAHGAGIGFPVLTPMLRLIMIVCGVVWGVQVVLGVLKVELGFSQVFGLVPARVVFGSDSLPVPHLWQPLTYMWLHSVDDPFHILLNMLLVWMLGSDLERHWGGKAFLRFYLVTGAGAGLFITAGGLLSPDPAAAIIPTVGASGAVYGLIVAFGMIFAQRIILFMMIFPMRARTFAWVMFGVSFFFTWSHSSGPVSHIAHLGGAVVGYAYLKRVWRVQPLIEELRWKLRRRRFKVMPPKDDDRWIH